MSCRTILYIFAIFICCLQLPTAASAKHRFALLIANQGYGAGVGQLKNPHKDVDRVAKTLKTLGFSVIAPLKDKSKDDILIAIHKFADEVGKKGDEAISFIFYAGHGIAVQGQNYLLPADIPSTNPLEVEVKGIRLGNVIDLLQRKAPHAAHFLTIDTCRNEIKGHRGAISLVQAPKRSGVHFSFSTQPGKTATDGGKKGSPFAMALAQELAKRGQDHDDVFRAVKAQVLKATANAQEPWVSGDIRQPVFFAGKPTVPPPPVPQVAKLRTHNWKMALAFPTADSAIGPQLVSFRDDLVRLSESRMQLSLLEPNKPVEPDRVLQAVGAGVTQLGWSTPGLWASENPVFSLFAGGLQLGMPADEFSAWLFSDDGTRQLNAAYSRFSVRSVPCGLTSSNGAGWFKTKINSIKDFKGLKIRTTGLNAKIAAGLGAKPVFTYGPAVPTALQTGMIDATLATTPVSEIKYGFHQIAKYRYEQGTGALPTVLEVLVNIDTWKALSKIEQNTIRFACQTNIGRGLRQLRAQVKDRAVLLKSKGIDFHTFPPDVVKSIEVATKKALFEASKTKPDIRATLKSLERNTKFVSYKIKN
jgi:TRAP-type mannitol/chloroaromatic compound transport system substrate-binding protein